MILSRLSQIVLPTRLLSQNKVNSVCKLQYFKFKQTGSSTLVGQGVGRPSGLNTHSEYDDYCLKGASTSSPAAVLF